MCRDIAKYLEFCKMWGWSRLRSALSRCLTEAATIGRAAAFPEKAAPRWYSTLSHSSVETKEAIPHPRVLPGYEGVRQLQGADSQVRQVFSLDLASQQEHNKAVIADTVQEHQIRLGDTGSTSVQIAVLSVRIKYLTEHIQKNRKDYSCLRALVQLVHRRRKLLFYLRRTNFQDYLKIVSELNLRHPVNERYPKKSVRHMNRIAEQQKNKKKRPFLRKK